MVLGGLLALAAGGLILFQSSGADAVSCTSAAAPQNDITVVPSHGRVFYIDTGVTPALDAGYIGYRVTNGTGSTQQDLWAQVSGFTGGKIGLSNAADSVMRLPTLDDAETGTAYFMLKATGGATLTPQAHALKVYDGRPDLAGASLLYECDFSFTKVQETIKAAANKVANNGLTSAAAIEVSDSSPELGQLVTITVEGQTGQIGQGTSPDFDMIWLTPAAISSWPTRALRLESVSIVFDGNKNWASTGDQVTFTDQLLIPDADGLLNVDNSEYRASYGFRVIGRPATSVKAVPIAQISSGTQVKHSDTGATGATLDLSFASLTVDAALTKSVTSTTGLTVVDCSGACAVPGGSGNGAYVEVPYRLTAETTSGTTLTVDEFVDQPPAGLIFKPGSATVTDIGRDAVAIDDPQSIVTDPSPKPNHFIGPFMFDSGTNATIDYTMYVPVGSFANTAYAKIGDFLIGATSSAMSRITVTSTGVGTILVVSDTADFGVSAITEPATGITSSAATLNGTVDPNGALLLTAEFQYGTSPTLSGATTVAATTPAGGDVSGLTDPTAVGVGLTGLASGTTYYYRVVAGAAQGTILSFTTAAVLAPPTVTTTAATSVTDVSATLNGTINPNLTAITGIQFIHGTVFDLSSGTTIVTLDDGTGLAALTAGGSSEQPFFQGVTGLTDGVTYYFKIRACTSALTGTYPDMSCSSFVDGSILSFMTGLTARTLTIDPDSFEDGYTMLAAPPTIVATPSAGSGTVTYSSSTAGVCTVDASTGEVAFVTAGTCTIGASIASDGTYAAADADEASFTVSFAPRTYAIDPDSFEDAYAFEDAPPTLSASPSAGGGTESFLSLTPGVCTVDASTGEVAFVTAGTCTIGASIASDGTYAAADADDVSFTVADAVGGGGGGGGGGPAPTAPSNPSVSIDGGAACTPTRDVTLSLSALSATEVLLANEPFFLGAAWSPFVSPAQRTWTLAAGDGARTVYALFKNGAYSTPLAFDTIVLDEAGGCVAPPDEPQAPSAPEGGTDDGGPFSEFPSVPPTDDFRGFSYAVYIVNPDGTVRTMTDPVFARVERLASDLDLVRFEDKGSDFDFDDVVLRVDHADWNRIVVTALSVDAGWRHNVRIAVYRDGALVLDRLVWADSHDGVGLFALIDADPEAGFSPDPVAVPAVPTDIVYLDPDGPLPPLPPMTLADPSPRPDGAPLACEVFCEDIGYDVFIVNPDGSQRHMGTEFVRLAASGDGRTLIGFEDSGRDFDFDDFQVLVDVRDCSAVAFEALPLDAAWHHRVVVRVFHRGAPKFDETIWEDTHAAVGRIRTVDAKRHPAMCLEASLPSSGGQAPPSFCALASPFTANLGPGSVGESVRRLQELLRCAGHFPAGVATTGTYGPITRDAVGVFQAFVGLSPVGFVGALTRAALNLFVR